MSIFGFSDRYVWSTASTSRKVLSGSWYYITYESLVLSWYLWKHAMISKLRILTCCSTVLNQLLISIKNLPCTFVTLIPRKRERGKNTLIICFILFSIRLTTTKCCACVWHHTPPLHHYWDVVQTSTDDVTLDFSFKMLTFALWLTPECTDDIAIRWYPKDAAMKALSMPWTWLNLQEKWNRRLKGIWWSIAFRDAQPKCQAYSTLSNAVY